MAATFEDNKKVMTEVLLNDYFSRHLGIEILEFEEKYIRARIPFK